MTIVRVLVLVAMVSQPASANFAWPDHCAEEPKEGAPMAFRRPCTWINGSVAQLCVIIEEARVWQEKRVLRLQKWAAIEKAREEAGAWVEGRRLEEQKAHIAMLLLTSKQELAEWQARAETHRCTSSP
jgi:hypothetical protein